MHYLSRPRYLSPKYGAEFVTYSFKPILRPWAYHSLLQTALLTAVGQMPNTFDTATVVRPSSRIAH